VNCLAIRSQRANMVAFLTSNMRPMEYKIGFEGWQRYRKPVKWKGLPPKPVTGL